MRPAVFQRSPPISSIIWLIIIQSIVDSMNVGVHSLRVWAPTIPAPVMTTMDDVLNRAVSAERVHRRIKSEEVN
jgi:hypothetical protein